MNNQLHIENCCDGLAFDIDEKEGNISDDVINIAINKATKEADIDREEFLKTFNRLYECNPFVYAKNERDDARDAKLNGGYSETEVLEPDVDDIFDPHLEGIIHNIEEELW